ncbi:MAG TPA: hypothetical protein VJ455_07135 [Ignavibacteria bacterium]|nr:hypothetical protein [Ignavibacteria bacterium]
MFKNISHIIFHFVIILTLANLPVTSQNQFTSRKGKVIIIFKYSDTTLSAASSNVLIKLNYSSAQVDLIIDTKDIKTGIDSLDTMLYSSNKILHLFAELKLDYIDTKRHPKQTFTFKGIIYHYNNNNSFVKNKIINLNGKGGLEHTSDYNNLPVCLLTLDFELDPDNLQTIYPYNLMKEIIKIKIIQTILKSK